MFQPHSAGKCDSPMCYLQTRFGAGEWPLDEVERFVPNPSSNCFRQSLLSLLASSDELLSSAATLLLLAVVNNDAVDHTLLRELELLPFRHRRHKKSVAAASVALARVPVATRLAEDDPVTEASGDEADDDDERLETSALSSTSSSDLSISSSQVSDTEGNDSNVDTIDDSNAVATGSDERAEASGSYDSSSPRTVGSTASSSSVETYVGQYPHWLMDVILAILARTSENRLLSTQLAARLLIDFTLDSQTSSHWLLPRHSAALKEFHSGCTHQVMESMRGAMADVDLFIYVLEDEFEGFERTPFPLALSFKSSSPFEFLVPPVVTDMDEDAAGGGTKSTLNLRRPTSEMEVCRQSMRAFLTLRKLRSLVDEHYVADSLEQFVAFRHPHTSALASSGTSAVSLEGMVFLRCMWREQRFLQTPAKLLLVLNPEAFVLAEKSSDSDGAATTADEGVVRLFAPVHRTFCAVDGKDERVLHVSVSSAVPVAGCRSSHKRGKAKQSVGATLKSWHVSVLFESREDCRQAKAHVDLSRAEVRAFKLLQIEESLTTHVRIPRSAADVESPKTKARRVSMDVEERRLKQEGLESEGE